MLKSVLHGIAKFFDTTPEGRILNRFSKDLDESKQDWTHLKGRNFS
jgi:hypothetical protein